MKAETDRRQKAMEAEVERRQRTRALWSFPLEAELKAKKAQTERKTQKEAAKCMAKEEAGSFLEVERRAKAQERELDAALMTNVRKEDVKRQDAERKSRLTALLKEVEEEEPKDEKGPDEYQLSEDVEEDEKRLAEHPPSQDVDEEEKKEEIKMMEDQEKEQGQLQARWLRWKKWSEAVVKEEEEVEEEEVVKEMDRSMVASAGCRSRCEPTGPNVDGATWALTRLWRSSP